MSYLALYRKWRPLVFEDVVEQEYVVKTLRNAVMTDRIAHAYLFCGTRGTGKTTMAKIFSRAINCLNPNNGDPCNQCEICQGILSGSILDVVEIDAASNNSVDNIRELRDEVIYAPTSAKRKVYIIDEVHMLTTGAFNALLKTLEEPPEHAVFILATTEPNKLPATILSRCQRYDFKRISVGSIASRVELVSKKSDIGIESDAAALIAKLADGALRDALSILDQCMAVGHKNITYEQVLEVAGIVNDTFVGNMVDAIHKMDVETILRLVDELIMDGKEPSLFLTDLITYYRNMLVCRISNGNKEMLQIHESAFQRIKDQGDRYEADSLMYMIKELSTLQASLKWASQGRILLEVGLVKLCEGYGANDVDGLMNRISVLERKIEESVSTPQAQVRQKSPGDNSINKRETSQKPVDPVLVIKGEELSCWKEVLHELKTLGKMQIFTFLMDTRAYQVDEKFISIVFKKGESFKMMIASKAEHSEVVTKILARRLGREVHLKFIEESSPMVTKKDALEQKAREIAIKGSIPFKVIDE